MGFGHICVDSGEVVLLGKGLDFGPDGRVVWAEEELEDFVGLRPYVSIKSKVDSTRYLQL